MSYCEKCDKTFSSRQSLWKHRQRKHQGQTDTIRSIVNKAVQGADKDTNPMMTVTPVKAPPYLTKNPMVTFNSKSDSEPESDSEESESSEKSDPESSEDAKFMPDNLEELKAAFRDLYKKVHNNMANYNKLVSILDKLYHVNCLTKEECDGIKLSVQKKIGML